MHVRWHLSKSSNEPYFLQKYRKKTGALGKAFITVNSWPIALSCEFRPENVLSECCKSIFFIFASLCKWKKHYGNEAEWCLIASWFGPNLQRNLKRRLYNAQNEFCTYTRMGTSDAHSHNTLQTMTVHRKSSREKSIYKFVWITLNMKQKLWRKQIRNNISHTKLVLQKALQLINSWSSFHGSQPQILNE